MLGKGNENSGQNYCGKPVFSNEEIVSRVFWCVVFHLQEEHRGWRTLEVFLDPVPLLMCLGANKQQADPLKQKDTLIIVWKYFICLFMTLTVFSILRKVYLSQRLVSPFVYMICQLVGVFTLLGEHKETTLPWFLWQIYKTAKFHEQRNCLWQTADILISVWIAI